MCGGQYVEFRRQHLVECGQRVPMAEQEDSFRVSPQRRPHLIDILAPVPRDFLAAQNIKTGESKELFDTLMIRNFIVEHTTDRSSEYARLLCTALRSFFRFLVLCGQTSRDLSNAVPMFRKYRQSVPPAFLSPSEVDRVLASTGSSIARSPGPNRSSAWRSSGCSRVFS